MSNETPKRNGIQVELCPSKIKTCVLPLESPLWSQLMRRWLVMLWFSEKNKTHKNKKKKVSAGTSDIGSHCLSDYHDDVSFFRSLRLLTFYSIKWCFVCASSLVYYAANRWIHTLTSRCYQCDIEWAFQQNAFAVTFVPVQMNSSAANMEHHVFAWARCTNDHASINSCWCRFWSCSLSGGIVLALLMFYSSGEQGLKEQMGTARGGSGQLTPRA